MIPSGGIGSGGGTNWPINLPFMAGRHEPVNRSSYAEQCILSALPLTVSPHLRSPFQSCSMRSSLTRSGGAMYMALPPKNVCSILSHILFYCVRRRMPISPKSNTAVIMRMMITRNKTPAVQLSLLPSTSAGHYKESYSAQ